MSFMSRQGLQAGLIRFGMISISPLHGSESPYTSAEECAKCHPSIYKYWSESTHAKAVQGELFPVVLDRALAPSPGWNTGLLRQPGPHRKCQPLLKPAG